MSKIILALALVAALAACAAHHDPAEWGALSQQVGKQINK